MRFVLCSLLAFALALAASAAPPPSPAAPPASTETAALAEKPAKPDKPVLLGPITREQVEAAVPDWVQAEVEAAPDPAAVKALAAIPPGAEVTIYMGSWCGDSRRELARLWRTLDEAGGNLPCTLRYIGVDHDKKEPADLLAGSDLHYVPTLIVKRDGREVGRIVESSPHGVEQDLLALLDGRAHGLVTGKAELQPHEPHR